MSKSKFKFIHTQGRALKQTEDKIQYFPPMWKDEFPLINNLGFYGIEWIYDTKSENNNPVLSRSGRKEMIELSEQYNVHLENIVLDWFISHPLLLEDKFTVEEKIEKLNMLISASAEAGFKHVILPFLEENNLSANANKSDFIKFFDKISNHLDTYNIELHLETSLPPQEEYQFVKDLSHNKVKICWDMGNSTSEGYLPTVSINTIKNFLGSIHIKDRLLHGPSVPIGTGAVKFYEIFSALNKIKFYGPFSIGVYRNKESDNIAVLRDSITFINNIIGQTYV